MTEPFDKTKLYPPALRQHIAEGHPPLYRVNRPDYDRLPLSTFLVATEMGTEGRVPLLAARIVKPRNPGGYTLGKLTPDNRLLYVFWSAGRAVTMLKDARSDQYRHVVMPGEDGFDLLDAFKIVCDHRRGRMTRPTLLYRALGLDVDLISEAPNITG